MAKMKECIAHRLHHLPIDNDERCILYSRKKLCASKVRVQDLQLRTFGRACTLQGESREKAVSTPVILAFTDVRIAAFIVIIGHEQQDLI